MNVKSPATIHAVVLEVLSERASFGKDIIDNVQKRTGGKLRLHKGSVYPALSRLEDQGFIEGTEAPDDDELDGAFRRFYKITESGRTRNRQDRELLDSLFPRAPL